MGSSPGVLHALELSVAVSFLTGDWLSSPSVMWHNLLMNPAECFTSSNVKKLFLKASTESFLLLFNPINFYSCPLQTEGRDYSLLSFYILEEYYVL